MSTSEKTGRAWVPATVTTLLVVVLLVGCGLAHEILVDREVSGLNDPDSIVGSFVYRPLAPLGGPGIVGDASFGDAAAQLGGGLVPVVILVFLFTWLSARAARGGSAFAVLLGSWLATVLGAGAGSLVAFEIAVRRDDLGDIEGFGLEQMRVDRLADGFYWGAFAGVLVGLVGLLAWVVARPGTGTADEPYPPRHLDPGPRDVAAPAPTDPSSYPPPSEGRPGAPAAEETVRAPDSGREP